MIDIQKGGGFIKQQHLGLLWQRYADPALLGYPPAQWPLLSLVG